MLNVSGQEIQLMMFALRRFYDWGADCPYPSVAELYVGSRQPKADAFLAYLEKKDVY